MGPGPTQHVVSVPRLAGMPAVVAVGGHTAPYTAPVLHTLKHSHCPRVPALGTQAVLSPAYHTHTHCCYLLLRVQSLVLLPLAPAYSCSVCHACTLPHTCSSVATPFLLLCVGVHDRCGAFAALCAISSLSVFLLFQAGCSSLWGSFVSVT